MTKTHKERWEDFKDEVRENPQRFLDNLNYEMTHCWKCDGGVAWNAEVCETCGNELMEHGKH
jgi:hypothetical protein